MAKELKTWGAARESEWLAAEDIDGQGDVPVRITAVRGPENIKINGKTKTNAVWVELVHAQTGRPLFGQRDRMTVSGARRKVLRALFGPNPQDAVGQTVLLYCEDTTWAGESVRGIRIRPKRVEVRARAPAQTDEPILNPISDEPMEPDRAPGEEEVKP